MNRRLFLPFALIVAVTSGLLAQTPVPAPTKLSAKLSDGDMLSVFLRWEAPDGNLSFNLYRASDSTTDFHLLAASLKDRGYRDTDIAPDHSYNYYVTSIRNDSESGPSDTVGIVVSAKLRGTISGTVTDDSTGMPLRGVRIKFFPTSSVSWFHWFLRSVYTDSLGHYEATLDTGTYLVKAEPLEFEAHWFRFYRPEWYDNAPEPSGATPVPVTDGSSFVADFGLSRPTPPTFVTVSGTVTDSSGTPLRRAAVAIVRTIQQMSSLAALTGKTPGLGEESMELEGVGHTRGVLWKGLTDSLGTYHARVIAGNDYIALASKRGYLPEYFDQKSDPTEADLIHVTADTGGIDFSLSPNPDFQNIVSGVVKDSTGTGVPSRIVLFPVRRGFHDWSARFAHTDSLGAYTIEHVRTGEYFVFAIPFSDYAPAFYKEDAYGVRHWKDADSVTISGTVTGIDIGVVPIMSDGIAHVGGTIHAADGKPVEGVSVLVLAADNSVVGYSLTDANGRYGIDGVSAGALDIVAVRDGYHESQKSVIVPPSAFTVQGVDLTLSPALVASTGGGSAVPTQFVLRQNYPNPFNPTTSISFDVPLESRVSMTVYNLLGQKVSSLLSDVVMAAGTRNVVWSGVDESGRRASSGLYFYKLDATPLDGSVAFRQVRKMVLLK